MNKNGAGTKKEKKGQREREEMQLEDVCLVLLLKNNNRGLFVIYMETLKGCRLFDEWANDK